MPVSLVAQQNMIKTFAEESWLATSGSCRIFEVIAKRCKPFSNSEFVKEYLGISVKEAYLSGKETLNSIPLSIYTVGRGINVFSKGIEM